MNVIKAAIIEMTGHAEMLEIHGNRDEVQVARQMLEILHKHIKGTALVDVAFACESENGCMLCIDMDGVRCYLTHTVCPGLGEEGCPAYIVKEESS